ncbi:transaldolase family protein [Streptomyces melanogenes]|uniref:transaldolase family protein n=1 Tax=Streptomyces melanogenes TaxID=67326 RepID=UPI0037879CEF
MKDVFARLAAEGVSVWLDGVGADRLDEGAVGRLVAAGRVGGATSVVSGPGRGERLAALAARGATPEEAVRELSVRDLRRACDLLLPVHERTGGHDGLVSADLDPGHARDAAATVAEARALRRAVDRPNLLVRIPATAEGLSAIAACLAEGIGVDATLIFSPERHRQVAAAFLDGLERALAAGHDLAAIASVASFSLAPLDAAVDGHLARAGSPEARAMAGRTALACARLAYEAYEAGLAAPRWRALAALGARPQRLVFTSTRVAEPGYRDTVYVEELVAPDVVIALPEAVWDAVADHGEVCGDRVRRHYADARRVLGYLPWFGVSPAAVAESLEAAGIDALTRARRSLRDAVGRELDVYVRSLALA